VSNVPVDVDEVNGTSVAGFQELGQPAQTRGVGGRGISDSGRTEIHRAVEVGQRFHVFFPTCNGGGDVDARPACVRTFTIISTTSNNYSILTESKDCTYMQLSGSLNPINHVANP